MKNLLKIAFLLLGILLLTFGCQKDDIQVEEVALENQEINFNFKTGKIEDFKELGKFVSKDIIDYQDLNYQFRSAAEDNNGFTIINDEITQFVDDNGTTFTLKIVKDNQEPNSFSNLIVNFNDENPVVAFIINYFPTDDYLQNIATNPETVFEGQYHIERIEHADDLSYLYEAKYECISISNTYCTLGGGLAPVGPACYNHPDGGAHIQTFTQSVCWEVPSTFDTPQPNLDNSVVSPDNPSGGGGTSGTSDPKTNPKFVTPCEVDSNTSLIEGNNVNVIENECDEENELVFEFYPNMDKDCQRNIINSFIANTDSPLVNFIRNTFLGNNQYNLAYEDIDLPLVEGEIPNANTVLPSGLNFNSASAVNIQFDNGYLDNATNLSIVMTAAHEFVHDYLAYLYAEGLLLTTYPQYTDLNTAFLAFQNDSNADNGRLL
ncbi:hypothetical protein [Ichthyenterobacterium magnum]|uniref:Zincin-like metallopeptidase toxin 3 of polymorphic toxin system n=1 Tax=Ichthyenterobacterium magnum TaxID=1230530 RepID=A0A420DWF0_9FLAO|nr:hypothetical protein [Ichthyenterobacterium magnum]RKE98558.1 hypothetical protein BXY80_0648 [Ichthyenterobacterium magnum]